MTPEKRAKNREYMAAYRKSEKGRMGRLRYSRSPAGQAQWRAYRETERGRLAVKTANDRFWSSAKGEAASARTYVKYKASPERQLKHRHWHVKAKYGLSKERYQALLVSQKGVCAICGGINKNGRRLSVDHNHTTGDVRGLLCSHCNFLLGLAKEDEMLLIRAMRYLQSHTEGEDNYGDPQ